MNKFLLVPLLIFLSQSGFSYTAEQLNSDSDLNLIISSSRGPGHKADLESHALEYWENNEDFYNLFDDGMNHHAYEQCGLDSIYDILDEEIDHSDWPELSVNFKSVKLSKGSRTIVYIVTPVATFDITTRYYKTRKDYENDVVSTKEVSCSVEYDIGYYYKNTKDKSVEFIGTTED